MDTPAVFPLKLMRSFLNCISVVFILRWLWVHAVIRNDAERATHSSSSPGVERGRLQMGSGIATPRLSLALPSSGPAPRPHHECRVQRDTVRARVGLGDRPWDLCGSQTCGRQALELTSVAAGLLSMSVTAAFEVFLLCRYHHWANNTPIKGHLAGFQ